MIWNNELGKIKIDKPSPNSEAKKLFNFLFLKIIVATASIPSNAFIVYFVSSERGYGTYIVYIWGAKEKWPLICQRQVVVLVKAILWITKGTQP